MDLTKKGPPSSPAELSHLHTSAVVIACQVSLSLLLANGDLFVPGAGDGFVSSTLWGRWVLYPTALQDPALSSFPGLMLPC